MLLAEQVVDVQVLLNPLVEHIQQRLIIVGMHIHDCTTALCLLEGEH